MMNSAFAHVVKCSFPRYHLGCLGKQNINKMQGLCIFCCGLPELCCIVAPYVEARHSLRSITENPKGGNQFVGTAIWERNQIVQLLRIPCLNCQKSIAYSYQHRVAKWLQAERGAAFGIFVKQFANRTDLRLSAFQRRLHSGRSKSGQCVGLLPSASVFSRRKPDSGADCSDRAYGLNPICPLGFIQILIDTCREKRAGKGNRKRRVSHHTCLPVSEIYCHSGILS